MKTARTTSPFAAQLLTHVARYRLTEARVLQRLYPRQCPTRRAAEHWLADLVEAGLLGTAPLFRRRPYFFLTEKGVQELTSRGNNQSSIAPEERSGPLSELAKVRCYAFLAFCCLSTKQRQRLTPAELQACFPGLYRPGLAMNYYLDTGRPQPRLGFLRIDAGGHGHWDRVLDRYRADLREHWAEPACRRLMQAGTFEITLVTALPQKVERLRRALAEGSHQEPIPVCVTAIPDLLYLIAPPAT